MDINDGKIRWAKYGSYGGCVQAVERTTEVALRAGFVLKADADQTIKDARSFQLSALGAEVA